MSMSEPKFTKGPWKSQVYRDFCQVTASNECGPFEICFAEPYAEEEMEETAANVALIAAAPEMYKVLEHCLDYITGGPFLTTQPTVEEIAGVLARARGEVQNGK